MSRARQLADGENRFVNTSGDTMTGTLNGTTIATSNLSSVNTPTINGNRAWHSGNSTVYHISDTRSGCPPTWAAGTAAVAHTFTLANPAYVVVHVNTIINYTARADTQLYVDGSQVRRTLTDTTNSSWKPAIINWGGNLAAGTHTIDYRSDTASVLGCGADWGSMTIIVYGG